MQRINYSLIILLLGMTCNVKAEGVVGKVDFVRGAVTAQHPSYGNRILGKSAQVYEEDVISTAIRSFVVIEMQDGTRMTIRPNSVMGVEKYVARKTENDSAILNLFKGGLRAITGFISKRREDAYKIRTPVVTMGIRGTEFDARLCSNDCQQEAKNLAKNSGIKSHVIGRVSFVRGKMSATDKHKKTRQVFVGGPLYEGDRLQTGLGAFAVLAFRDKSRVTLQADSEFLIEEHHYEEAKPEKNSAIMSLVRGGLRALSGLIGKNRKDAYKMRTPVATIGIRGTGYDLLCEGDCVAAQKTSFNTPLDKILNMLIKSAVAIEPGSDGMYAHVWSGAINLVNDSGELLLNENQVAFLNSLTAVPVIVPQLPIFMRSNPAPRPDTVEVPADLFNQTSQDKADPGLYVSVYDGHVSVENEQGNRIDLGEGEAAFSGLGADQLQPVRLNEIPTFQAQDFIPMPDNMNETYDQLFTRDSPGSSQDLNCETR